MIRGGVAAPGAVLLAWSEGSPRPALPHNLSDPLDRSARDDETKGSESSERYGHVVRGVSCGYLGILLRFARRWRLQVEHIEDCPARLQSHEEAELADAGAPQFPYSLIIKEGWGDLEG